jgi:hypothetical protein
MILEPSIWAKLFVGTVRSILSWLKKKKEGH